MAENAMGKCKGGNCNLGELKEMLKELDGGRCVRADCGIIRGKERGEG